MATGASLRATEQPIDTSTAAGKCLLDMLGVFAEFETNLRRERQLEGIADAKARGVYKGRKPSINPVNIKQMKADGRGPSAIAIPKDWSGIGLPGVGRVSRVSVLKSYSVGTVHGDRYGGMWPSERGPPCTRLRD